MNIDERFGYWLLRLSRSFRTRLQSQLANHGLYVGQDLLLMQLWAQDGLTQSELADRLQIQQATLTRMITRMSASGLLTRKPDGTDGRVSRVYLSQTGTLLEAPVMKIWENLEAQIFKTLTLEERLLLRRLLMQIEQDLE